MTEELEGTIGTARRPRRQRGQAATEFAISSIVLLLILSGLIDLSRVFYFQVDTYGAAREGARTGSWFDTPTRHNPQLDDADILSAVSDTLQGAGIPRVTTNGSIALGHCPNPTDGNSYHNPPYYPQRYPSSPNTANVYLCYTPPSTDYGGCGLGTSEITSVATAPTNDCWRLGDLNVMVMLTYGLVTPLLQSALQPGGGGIHVAANSHMEIQGKP